MKNLKIIILLAFIVVAVFDMKAQRNNESDSLAIKDIVFEFYDWYIESILKKQYSEFKPDFVENENGMTTLDFTEYFKNLRKYHFSEALIKKEKESYQVCISNLGKVKYSDFLSQWTDLDNFESTGCDFGNSYRWLGLMEPIECFRFTEAKFMENDQGFVSIEYCSSNLEGEKKYWGNKEIYLEQQNSKWKIIKIK